MIRKYIEEDLAAWGLNREQMLRMELAVEEIVVNIANYAYSPAGNGEVELACRMEGRMINVSLADWGRPFNPLEKNDPDLTLDLESREPGGLGIYLTKNLADSCRYERADGKNILTISLFMDEQPDRDGFPGE